MKKILLLVVAMIAVFNMVAASADNVTNKGAVRATGCNYREYMHIQGPVGTRILMLSANVIRVEQASATDFQIIGSCDGGYDGSVVAKIGTDANHFAELTIVDGQLMWNPEVTNIKSAGGFNYTGIDHPIGTFEYTLRFARG